MQSKGLSRVFSNTTVHKHQRGRSALFIVQLSHPYMTTGKTIALTRWTSVGTVTSLLFNMLSRLVITFLPRSKHLLISWLQSPSAVVLEPPQNKISHCFHCEKVGLKLNIQKTKIMASSPITSWQINGGNVETVKFHFVGLQDHCGR